MGIPTKVNKPKTTNTLVIAITTGTGGKEFERESEAFTKHWRAKPGHRVELFKMRKDRPYNMRMKVLASVGVFGGESLDRLVFFCHGTWKHLKCGFHIWNVDELAEAMRPHVRREIDIALYACSCGRMRFEWPWRLTKKTWPLGDVLGKHGFGARLGQACVSKGFIGRVFCHGSKGHTTRNPYCYIVEPGIGGSVIMRLPIVQRGSPSWKDWKQSLKTERRFEVPFE